MTRWLLVIITIVSVRCSTLEQPISEKLRGHWHLVGEVGYSTKTLDIFDSISIIDHYSFLGYDQDFSLYDSAGKIFLPEMCCSEAITACVDKFHFSNDTLVYDTSRNGACAISKYIKSDLQKCRWSHAVDLSYLEFSEFPLQSRRLVGSDSATRISVFGSVIMVGFSNDQPFGAPKIQVRDVLISFDHIPAAAAPYKTNFPVCLVIDERVRKSFTDSVINAIPKSDSIQLFRLVSVKGSNEVGYERMN